MRPPDHDPVVPVAAQLDAYNARDIDRFMSCWAGTCRYSAFPDTLLAEGADAIRERHLERFKEPDLHATLLSRMVAGSLVVDHEVQAAKIVAAWFRIGERRLY